MIKKCASNNQQQPSTYVLIAFVICLAHFLLFPLATVYMYVYMYVRHSHIRDVYLYVCTRGVDTSSEGWSIDVLLTTVRVLFTSVTIVSVRNGFTRICMRFFSSNLKRLTNMCIVKKKQSDRDFFSLWSQITGREESTVLPTGYEN